MDEEKLLDPSTMTRNEITSWGFPRFMSQDLLLDASAGYCVDGKIMIEALISVQTLRSASEDSDEADRVRVVLRTQRYAPTSSLCSVRDSRRTCWEQASRHGACSIQRGPSQGCDSCLRAHLLPHVGH
eukprot:2331484-Rhodomonas_salina.1